MVVNILKEAIEKRKKIEIVYENSVRIVDPYLVGINQKDHISLRAFSKPEVKVHLEIFLLPDYFWSKKLMQ